MKSYVSINSVCCDRLLTDVLNFMALFIAKHLNQKFLDKGAFLFLHEISHNLRKNKP